MKATRQYRYGRTVLAAAMLSVFGAAYGDDITDLTKPQGFVSVGAAGVSGDSKDRSLFGQFNGLRKEDAYFLLDFGYVTRDEATGTWTIVEGRNLGLENREVRGLFGPQGNWKIYGEYTEIVRRDPRTYNSSLQGAGSTTPAVSLLPTRGTGSDLELKLERKRATIGGEKRITPNLTLEASFTNEDKSGERLWGRGFNCPSGAAPTGVCTALASGANQWAILFLPEPVSATSQQIEAKVNYVTERLTLTGGYYGSFYKNDNQALTPTITGNLNNALNNPMGTGGGVALTTGLRNILQLPMALWPDNEAHQFSISGNYRFTPTTVGNFRYAYTTAKQEDDFTSFGGAPSGRTNLGAKVNTTLAQAGLVVRPISRVSILANVRYEDRDDKTPIDFYNVEGTDDFTNGDTSSKKFTGKLQATYQAPMGFRATAGFDYDSVERADFVPTNEVAGLSGLKQKTHDNGYRLELQRSMSESLNGIITFTSSKREGSTWLKPLAGPPGVLPASGDCPTQASGQPVNACIYSRTAIFPFMFEDRKRDKVRVLADWSPAERLSVQLAADFGKDDYSGPTEKGLQDTKVRLYSADVSFRVNDATRLSAYYSYGEQSLNVAHSTGYVAEIKDKNTTAGVGLMSQVTPKLKLGADLMYIQDRNVYNDSLDSLASAANVAFRAQSGGLPDVTYRDARLKLTGAYAVQKNADVVLEVVHDRVKLDEWTWGWNGVAFAFSDNTTVSLKPEQNVTFVSVRYTYRFR